MCHKCGTVVSGGMSCGCHQATAATSDTEVIEQRHPSTLAQGESIGWMPLARYIVAMILLIVIGLTIISNFAK